MIQLSISMMKQIFNVYQTLVQPARACDWKLSPLRIGIEAPLALYRRFEL